MTVKIIHVKDDAELFLHLPRQGKAQPCYIHIDTSRGAMWADVDATLGGMVSFDIWHGRELRYSIPSGLTAESANALMDRIAPLADRVLAGASIMWNGHDHVGKFSDDASEASDEIERICAEMEPAPSDTIIEWDAESFFDAVKDELEVAADSTDDELKAKAARLESEHATDEATGAPMILRGTYEYLVSLRENMQV